MMEFTHDCVNSMQVCLVIKVYPALDDFAHFNNPSFFLISIIMSFKSGKAAVLFESGIKLGQ